MPYHYADLGLKVSAWYAVRAAVSLLDGNQDQVSKSALHLAWLAAAAAATDGLDWKDPAWDRALRNAWVVSGHEAVDDADEWEELRHSDAVWEMGWDDFAAFPGWPVERRHQANLLRCIFGNPKQPKPRRNLARLMWNTAPIPALAQVIYEQRAFDRMPILADALEEAGCDNEPIITHCRQPAEHTRGCWVLDWVLAKK
jgi:hypothetical protein